MVYKKISTAKTMRAFYDPGEDIKHGSFMIEELSDNIKNNSVLSKEVLTHSKEAEKYQKHMGLNNPSQQIKILPPGELGGFNADHIITDDSFYFIEFGKEILGIEIKSHIFIEAQKAIFDSLWNRL